jgi:predicted PurR-regulated permease PerM
VVQHRGVRIGFFAILVGVFAYLSWLIIRPFLSFVLGALLVAFAMYPAQRRLASRVDARLAAAGLVALALAVTVAVLALLVVSLPVDAAELSAAIERFPATAELEAIIEATVGVEVPLGQYLAEAPQRFAELLLGDLTGIIGAAIDASLGVFLAVILLYYLLKNGNRLTRWVRRSMPMGADTTEQLFEEARATTWAVLKSHVFIAIIQALIAGVGLFAVGIPNVVFWTVVMMILGLLPLVGVILVLGPAVLYLVFVENFLAAAFLAGYSVVIVGTVDDYLRAAIVDRGSALHTGVILVGVFGGVYVFGVMGLFYGPIVLGLFQAMIRLFNEQYDETP